MEKVIMYRNKGERVAVMKKLDKMGYKWSSGTPIKELHPTEYDDVGGGISLHETNKTIMYGNAGYYKGVSYRYELIPASEFIGKKNKPILIYRKGRAVYAEDKNTGIVGTAICSPDDKFDFYTGAMIALCRLVGDNIGDDAKAEMRKLMGEEPSADADEIKVGDRVRIKAWDAMKSEYNVDPDGDICHDEHYFVAPMRHLCGRTATVEEIKCGSIAIFELNFDDKSGDLDWGYYEWMLEKIDKDAEESGKIKVGDTVMVVDNGACYSMYDTWVKDNVTNINDCIHYCYKKSIPAGEYHRYTVIAIGPHGRDSKEVLYYIKNIATEECFLMGKWGIEKA